MLSLDVFILCVKFAKTAIILKFLMYQSHSTPKSKLKSEWGKFPKFLSLSKVETEEGHNIELFFTLFKNTENPSLQNDCTLSPSHSSQRRQSFLWLKQEVFSQSDGGQSSTSHREWLIFLFLLKEQCPSMEHPDFNYNLRSPLQSLFT